MCVFRGFLIPHRLSALRSLPEKMAQSSLCGVDTPMQNAFWPAFIRQMSRLLRKNFRWSVSIAVILRNSAPFPIEIFWDHLCLWA